MYLVDFNLFSHFLICWYICNICSTVVPWKPKNATWLDLLSHYTVYPDFVLWPVPLFHDLFLGLVGFVPWTYLV